MSYALVAGYDNDDPKSSQKTEVLYVNGTTKICHSIANYPENVQYLSGGSFLENNLIVGCGGSNNLDYDVTSACYSMNIDLKWTNFANLATLNQGIATAIVKNGLWDPDLNKMCHSRDLIKHYNPITRLRWTKSGEKEFGRLRHGYGEE